MMKLRKPATKYESVMLIDDSEIDNYINSKIIETAHFAGNVFVHTSSASALEFLKNIEKAKQKNKGLLPQIIFLDLNMPIMDGLQFLAEFSNLNPRITSKCKICLLTASQNPDEIKAAKKSSFVKKIIQKPLSEMALMDL